MKNTEREFKKLPDTVLQLPDVPISCEYTEFGSGTIDVICRFKGFLPANNLEVYIDPPLEEEKEIYFPMSARDMTAPYKFSVDLNKKNLYEQGDEHFERFVTKFKFVSHWKAFKKTHPNITKEEFLLEEARHVAKIVLFKGITIIKVDENNDPTGEVF